MIEQDKITSIKLIQATINGKKYRDLKRQQRKKAIEYLLKKK